MARTHDGQLILGVFNVDRYQAVVSFKRQAALDADVACFGHAAPVTHGAAAGLRAASDLLPA